MIGTLLYRSLSLLAAALVAIWPAANASACCCGGDREPAIDGSSRRGCCASGASHCATSELSAVDCLHCCPSTDERDACDCQAGCGQGAASRDVSAQTPPWRTLGDAVLTAAWHDPRPQRLACGILESASKHFSQRPLRVLYCVWRN